MKGKKIFIAIIILTVIISLVSQTKNPKQKVLPLFRKILPPESKPIDIVAKVGGVYKIARLSGWTSPFAEVTLESLGVAPKKTTANSKGVFIFENISLPEKPNEICLISQDVNLLSSFPLCLPPPSPTNNTMEITEILLSPSLSLESNQILRGKTAKASGMTFPNSKVQIYFFIEKSVNSTFWALFSKISNPFSHAIAAEFPLYEIQSNSNGYFEFSLPAINISGNRLFVVAIKQLPNQTQSYFSPKSNTLFFRVLGIWDIIKYFILKSIQKLLPLLKNWKNPSFVIVLEISILVVLIILSKYRKNNQNKSEQ